MNGCFGGCLGRTLAFLLLLALVILAWRWGPDAWERMASDDHEGPPPSPMVAQEVEARVVDFMASAPETEERFSAQELESLLRYSLIHHFPPGVTEPSLRIQDSELTLGVRVAADRIPALPELEQLRSILPDTVPVQLRGRLLSLDGGEAGFLVHRIDAAGLPIPRRFFPQILAGLNPDARPDLPPEAVAIPLPEGVRSARIEEDQLVLVRGGAG